MGTCKHKIKLQTNIFLGQFSVFHYMKCHISIYSKISHHLICLNHEFLVFVTSAFHILILLLFVAISVIGSEEVSVSERLVNDRKWKLKYGGLGTGHYELYFSSFTLSMSTFSGLPCWKAVVHWWLCLWLTLRLFIYSPQMFRKKASSSLRMRGKSENNRRNKFPFITF